MKIIITEDQLRTIIGEQYQVTATDSRPTQNSVPVVKTIKKSPFWGSVIDFFLPGTPIEDGYDIINKFSDIIQRRIDYNKKNNLPLDKMTKEEIDYRNRILKATPNDNYPTVFGLSKIVSDIKLGKNIRQEEFKNYTNPSFWSINIKKTPEKSNKILDKWEELKKMWLGIDDPNGLTTGYWVKSEFKPNTSKDPKAIYYKPKNIPKLNPQKFDELYGAILSTKKSDGTFPGGNSKIINDMVYNDKFKYVKPNDIKNLQGDEDESDYMSLGNFKLGASEEGGKKYISIYDEWDLAPPSLKKIGLDIQKFGKTPLIYYRIYRP